MYINYLPMILLTGLHSHNTEEAAVRECVPVIP